MKPLRKWRIIMSIVLSLCLLTRINSFVVDRSDTDLVLSGVDGELVMLNAWTGAVKWRTRHTTSPLVSTSPNAGILSGAHNQLILPGIDGSLFAVTDITTHNVQQLDASIRDLVNMAPFCTKDGTRIVGVKHTSILVVDVATGDLREVFSPDEAWPPQCKAHSNDLAQQQKFSQCKAREHAQRTLWLGKTDWMVRAIGDTMENISWSVRVSRISSCTAQHEQNAVHVDLPNIFADTDGSVWARSVDDDTILWRIGLSSPMSTLHVRQGSNIASIKFQFTSAPDAPIGTPITQKDFHISKMNDNQVFVLAMSRSHSSSSSSSSSSSFLPSPHSALLHSTLSSALSPSPHEQSNDQSSPLFLLPAQSTDIAVVKTPSAIEKLTTDETIRPDSLQIVFQLPEHISTLLLLIGVTIAAIIFLSKLVTILLSRVYSSQHPQQITSNRDNNGNNTHEENESAQTSSELTIGKITINKKKLLGLGSHGTIVFDGCFEGRQVAVKRLQKHLFAHASNEITFLIASDSHPHVVRYFCREDDTNFIYVALERCRGSLADVVNGDISAEYFTPLSNSIGKPNPRTLNMLKDIVAGVGYLHSVNIVHRDLKPQNVLISDEYGPKIADMGLSTRLDNERSSFDSCVVGSTGWHAPEVINNGRLTRAVDIFSLGSLIFYVLTGGKHPFGEPIERDSNIMKDQYNIAAIAHIPEAIDLIQSMITHNPLQRTNCSEILRHPFFFEDERKLEFLQEVSDRIEFESIDSPLRQIIETQAAAIVTKSWNRVLDQALLENIGKYRKYSFSSICDCLRVIRNKKNHYRDLPLHVQTMLGPYPHGFLQYFTRRFPSLLLYVHAFAGAHCAHEFTRWFDGVNETTLRLRWKNWTNSNDSID